MNEVVVGIDIGSSKVCTIIGTLDKSNSLKLLGVGMSECKGLKKGIIVDIDNTVEAIKESIAQAERMSDMEIKGAFINIAGGHATLIKNNGVIAVSREDMEITHEDVDRVLSAAIVVNLPMDKEIIGVIPLKYTVDGYDNIKDPVGLIGTRLEAEVYIIAATTAYVQNLVRSVERCNIDVLGIVLDPLASGEAVLTKEEKELGVALIDVGGESTDISIFKGNNLVYTKLIPVGGMHITRDISIGLKVTMAEAEALKREYGYASVSMLKTLENISLRSVGASSGRVVTNKQLVDIIEARVQEIYYLVNKELEKSGLKGNISSAVITGGGVSFIKGSLETGASIICLPLRIGKPAYIGASSPIFSTGTGIVKYVLSLQKGKLLIGHSSQEEREVSMTKLKKDTASKGKKIMGKLREFLTDFF